MMRAQQHTSSSRTVFYVAASADDTLATELEKHLRILKNQDSIMNFSGNKITPGLKNLRTLEQELTQASVVLLLISPDFLASDVCNVVMRQALELSLNENRIVVPILLRPVSLENALFAHLECIPHNRRFVSTARDRDEAFVEIAEALVKLFNQPLPSEPRTTLSTSSGHFTSIQDQVNRERLLKRVHTIWIKGVLEQWLHNATLLHPNLHELPSAIENPWEPIMKETKLPSAEYLEQQTRLTLSCAVIVQPLTEQQIDLYLSSAGKLEVLRSVLIEDEALHAFATTPLMLNILIQTDQKMIARNLADTNIEILRYAIFTAYVESMLSRREKNMLYTPVRAKNWLARLAQQMERHKQIIFYPGHIQPDWLTEKRGVVVYYTGNGLIGALLSGMLLGLVGNL